MYRDEKDRPFCGLTRTGFGADFKLVGPSDLGPDWSVGGLSESDRTEKIGPKVSKSHPCTSDSDRTGVLVVRPSRTGRTGPKKSDQK